MFIDEGTHRLFLNQKFKFLFSYYADGYYTRLNYYSSSNILFQGIYPTGNNATDNAGLLMDRRFLMAAVGDESMSCTLLI
jgi:hypothetical protein